MPELKPNKAKPDPLAFAGFLKMEMPITIRLYEVNTNRLHAFSGHFVHHEFELEFECEKLGREVFEEFEWSNSLVF